jgi:hypothetical protein
MINGNPAQEITLLRAFFLRLQWIFERPVMRGIGMFLSIFLFEPIFIRSWYEALRNYHKDDYNKKISLEKLISYTVLLFTIIVLRSLQLAALLGFAIILKPVLIATAVVMLLGSLIQLFKNVEEYRVLVSLGSSLEPGSPEKIEHEKDRKHLANKLVINGFLVLFASAGIAGVFIQPHLYLLQDAQLPVRNK